MPVDAARRPRALPLGLAAAALLLPLLPAPALADAAELADARLPSARGHTSAVWTGQVAYIFGGQEGLDELDEVVRYDPAADDAVALAVHLPRAVSWTASVWAGTRAYVFGGTTGNDAPVDDIVRFDPAAGAAGEVAQLPAALTAPAAVWTGQYAFIFGGKRAGAGDYSDDILRFDPSTNELVTMQSNLPTPRSRLSAVWTGTYVFLFGGHAPAEIRDDIVRYDPARDEIATMDARLPQTLQETSAAWDGRSAFVFGGNDGAPPTDDIVRYDPVADEATTMDPALPSPRGGTSAAWTGSHAYVFGGDPEGGTDEIVRYDPKTPGKPRNVAAARGPDVGQIRLTWDAPAYAGHSAVTAYEIHRGDAAGQEQFHTQVGDVRTWTDTALPDGAQRFYRLKAVNAHGPSPFSAEVNARAPDVPGAPENVQALPELTPGRIRLTWSPPDDDGGFPIARHRVYRGTEAGRETLYAEVANVNAYTDPAARLGNVYFYKVSALNRLGEGRLSAEAFTAGTGLPPAAPGLPLGDQDRDLVPDAVEAALCRVEDRNTPGDGACVGDDYDPPIL